jgi:hypothetical protein
MPESSSFPYALTPPYHGSQSYRDAHLRRCSSARSMVSAVMLFVLGAAVTSLLEGGPQLDESSAIVADELRQQPSNVFGRSGEPLVVEDADEVGMPADKAAALKVGPVRSIVLPRRFVCQRRRSGSTSKLSVARVHRLRW